MTATRRTPRAAAVPALNPWRTALGLVAPHVTALTLGICAGAVVVAVAVVDRVTHPVL